MSAKETNDNAIQTTTHYWGYREIDPSEFKYVGGGDDGGGDGGGDCGGDCGDSGDSGSGESDASAGDTSVADAAAAAAQADTDPSTNGSISDVTDASVAGIGCNIAGGLVGLGIGIATGLTGIGLAAGVIGGGLATGICEIAMGERA
jgi:hypothetical protein